MNGSDVAQTKSRVSQPVDSTNFRVVGQFHLGMSDGPDLWHGSDMPKVKRKTKSKTKPKRQGPDFSQIALAVVHKATGTKLKRH